jgi:RNA polymerase sigma factor (sigma-70 family)
MPRKKTCFEYYLEIADQLFAYLLRKLQNHADSEDILQEIGIAASQIDPDDEPDNPRGWLFSVAYRRLNDFLRRHYRRAWQEGSSELEEIEAEDQTGRSHGNFQSLCIEEREIFSKRLRRLKKGTRWIIYWRFRGMSVQEMAKRWGVSMEAAYKRVRRAEQEFYGGNDDEDTSMVSV